MKYIETLSAVAEVISLYRLITVIHQSVSSINHDYRSLYYPLVTLIYQLLLFINNTILSINHKHIVLLCHLNIYINCIFHVLQSHLTNTCDGEQDPVCITFTSATDLGGVTIRPAYTELDPVRTTFTFNGNLDTVRIRCTCDKDLDLPVMEIWIQVG